MGKIRFYLDEHVSGAVLRGLKQRGIDVVDVNEAGTRSVSDLTHIERAHSERRVIFTQDADYLRLSAQGHEHAGIIYAPQRTSVGEIVQGLVLIHQVLDSEELFGKVEYL